MLRLHVVGWRHLTHSFALVNQWQILALARRGDVHLSFTDARLIRADWQQRPGAFGQADTQVITALGPPDGRVDAEYRITFPFDLASPPDDRRVLVFGVTENWAFPPGYLLNGAAPADIIDHPGMRWIVPSRWARDGFVANGVAPERIDVVPHGVDVATFRPDDERRAGMRARLGLEGFVFLSVGSLLGTKGIGVLLDAFAAALERGTRATLVLKGSDGLYGSQSLLRTQLAQMTERRRHLVLANMKYLGLSLDSSQMAALYNAADAYVSPYLAEGFCMPVLEAAASGLPILCTGGGATDDFTTDAFRRKIAARLDTSGGKRRFRPEVEHLAGLMQQLPDDLGFVQEAKLAGPRHAATGYRWDDVAAQLVELAIGPG